MAQRLDTPGVYIREENAFPNSVAGLPTAVPAFVGYTQNILKDGMSLVNKPIRLTSMAEYTQIFGGAPTATFNLREFDAAKDSSVDLAAGGKNYVIEFESASRFLLYDSMRLFFANGGSNCYVVSAGDYSGAISKKALDAGIEALVSAEEPTMLVIPEAVMLDEEDCFGLQQSMLIHCGYKMRSRFAILDVFNGASPRNPDKKQDLIVKFRENVGNDFLDFGSAYYPWVQTSIVQNEEVSFENIANLALLEQVLTADAQGRIKDADKLKEVSDEIAKINSKKAERKGTAASLSQTLKVVSPIYKNLLGRIRTQLNVLPPSAGIAGVYSMVDNTRGVFKAPANVGMSQVVAPMVPISSEQQEDLNVTTSGKSINAIRTFTGEGTLIWGARTLDGNSQDWRYINVRRTMIFIEQSIKYAAKAYVFEPNTSGTWVLVRSMIASFLNDLWKAGGLAGGTPDQAYQVMVGLGSTMTPEDILNGIMKITVRVAVTRPAEFIVITFQQKMQES